MNLSHAYGVSPSEDEGARLLNYALDAGVTLLDTAALYGGGRNEALLGRAVMHRRADFTLASKCVLAMRDGQRVIDGRPETIKATLDAALARLRTDRIDLYYLHRLDRQVPVEESVGALVRAREAGKIRAIGLSEMSAATIARAHAVHPIVAVQNEYSPVVRNPEAGVLAACRERGIALVAYSPLARGLLPGAVRHDRFVAGDIRLGMPRFREPNLSHNLAAIGQFDALARERCATPAQLALAWLLARDDTVVPIPGTTSIAHLDENLSAADLRLDDATMAQVDAIFAPGAIRGPRYAAAAQAQIDTETLPGEELAAG